MKELENNELLEIFNTITQFLESLYNIKKENEENEG